MTVSNCTRNTVAKRRTGVSCLVSVDVVGCGVIGRITANVLRVCALVYSYVVYKHNAGEFHSSGIDLLPIV